MLKRELFFCFFTREKFVIIEISFGPVCLAQWRKMGRKLDLKKKKIKSFFNSEFLFYVDCGSEKNRFFFFFVRTMLDANDK